MVELTDHQRARAQVLRHLARDGGPLAPTAPTATTHNPAWFRPSLGRRLRPTPERLALHDDLLEAFYTKMGRGDIGNRAIMLAGPPGQAKAQSALTSPKRLDNGLPSPTLTSSKNS